MAYRIETSDKRVASISMRNKYKRLLRERLTATACGLPGALEDAGGGEGRLRVPEKARMLRGCVALLRERLTATACGQDRSLARQ